MNLTLLRSMMTVFENRLQQMEGKVNTVEAMKGDKGDRGEAGIAGPAGPTGKQGRAGAKGKDGKDGVDGKDGEDGVGVESASIDLDGHLVFTLTDGSTLDAGSLEPLIQDGGATKIIHTHSGGSGVNKESGKWGYASGITGVVELPAKARVLQVSATTENGGSFTVNGGDAVVIPDNQQFTLEPKGNLVNPAIEFVGTTSYVVEYVT